MRAVILAGGFGLRLRPYTTVLPKPLVPVGDRPVLEHIIRRLAAAGIHDIDVCLNHLGELIQAYFSQAGSLPGQTQLSWHWESQPMGTAGAVGAVGSLTETFLVINGDVLTTVDFSDLLAHHRQHGAVVTIASQERTVPIDLGVIETEDGFVADYLEKPTLTFAASLGIYVYEPRALTYLPAGPCQFPDLVTRLLAAGERVAAFPARGEAYDIGTPSEHERASRALADHPDEFAA
jgi:NDP-mannose synthase